MNNNDKELISHISREFICCDICATLKWSDRYIQRYYITLNICKVSIIISQIVCSMAPWTRKPQPNHYRKLLRKLEMVRWGFWISISDFQIRNAVASNAKLLGAAKVIYIAHSMAITTWIRHRDLTGDVLRLVAMQMGELWSVFREKSWWHNRDFRGVFV